MFACYGTNVSADATSSPRFSDGVVRGYSTNDTIVPHRTTFFGLFGRNAECGDAYPFNLPMTWLAQRDEIDLTKPVNFVSTNDVAIGSAGSVVVNADLEVVGVVVDGNAESLHNDFVFTDDAARAVSTHVDGIIEALEKVYGADRVVEELVGR